MKGRYIGLGIGLLVLAAGSWLAVDAWRNIRRETKDKSIATYQISAAADQYFLEYGGKSIRYEDLIGPGKYLKYATPVDGEDYHELFPIPIYHPELAVTMGDGRRVIVFAGKTLRQDADGSFPKRYNRDPVLVEQYQRWIANGRPPLPYP